LVAATKFLPTLNNWLPIQVSIVELGSVMFEPIGPQVSS